MPEGSRTAVEVHGQRFQYRSHGTNAVREQGRRRERRNDSGSVGAKLQLQPGVSVQVQGYYA
jgi:hypothetical protein